MASLPQLIRVFEDAKVLVARPGNDFSYSGWAGVSGAYAELDVVLAALRGGDGSGVDSIYFLPTGPLQELAISSGWGDEFLALADRFDAAVAAPADEFCPCLSNPSSELETRRELGLDAQFGEVSLRQCPRCGQVWLHYALADEAFSGSGRWYLGAVSPAALDNLTVAEARGEFAQLGWYFFGGSYFGGQSGRTQGPIS